LHSQYFVDLSVSSVAKSSLPETVQFKTFAVRTNIKVDVKAVFYIMILGPKSLEHITTVVIDPKKILRQFSLVSIAEILER
jgi:hypothetical protein